MLHNLIDKFKLPIKETIVEEKSMPNVPTVYKCLYYHENDENLQATFSHN